MIQPIVEVFITKHYRNNHTYEADDELICIYLIANFTEKENNPDLSYDISYQNVSNFRNKRFSYTFQLCEKKAAITHLYKVVSRILFK